MYRMYRQTMEKIMIKKNVIIILSVILCIACSAIMVACNSNDTPSDDISHIETPDTDESSLDDLSIIIEGFSFDNTNGFISVANSQEVFTFNEKVKVNSNSTWELSLDIYGLLPITTNTIQLSVGDNCVYLLVTSKNSESSRLYTLNVRRRPIYTVSFDTLGGTSIDSESVEENELCTVPNSPEKEGYSFVGWDYDLSSPITDNIEVNAKWEANTYKVYYNYEGGSYYDNRAFDEVTFDSEYQLIVPMRSGYTFLGWYTSKGKEYKEGIWSETSDIQLIAKWIIGDAYWENDTLFIYFGRYPQQRVSDETLIHELTYIYQNANPNQNGYYEFNGQEYGVKSEWVPSEENPAMEYPVANFFYVQPIKWRVIDEGDDSYTLISEMIIDCTSYGNIREYANSNVREKLTTTMFNSMFNEDEKDCILQSTIDNTLSSTAGSTNEYVCSNTNDSIYLLSNYEVNKYLPTNTARKAFATEYAQFYHGVSVDSLGYGEWITRSPNSIHVYGDTAGSFGVSNYNPSGELTATSSYYTNSGLRPAIKILKFK